MVTKSKQFIDVLTDISVVPKGYSVILDGKYLMKDNDRIYVKLSKNGDKVDVGVSKKPTVEGYSNAKMKARFLEDSDALAILNQAILRPAIDNVDTYLQYVDTENSYSVMYDPFTYSIVVHTAIYKLGYGLVNRPSNNFELLIKGERVLMDIATFEKFKADFTDYVITRFASSWELYCSRIIHTLEMGESKNKIPYVYLSNPHFRLMAFSYEGREPGKSPVVNPFLEIDSVSRVLKSSKLWSYMEANSEVVSLRGVFIKCYFVSSVEFCRALNLTQHVQFPSKKNKLYYSVFFGLLYPSKFISRTNTFYVCNDRELLSENPSLKGMKTVDDLRLIPSNLLEYFEPIGFQNIIADNLRECIKTKESKMVKKDKIVQMISGLRLLNADE